MALWQLGDWLGLIPTLFLPSPAAIAVALYRLTMSGELWKQLSASLARLAIGWIVGTVFGIALGLAVGISSLLRSPGMAVVSALFPIPKIALVPLFIIWFGIGEGSKIATLGFGVFFPTVIATAGGVDNVPRSLVEELARVTSTAQQEWTIARREDDFARLRPWLESIFALKRREADCLGFVENPYDLLLDEYEPGATASSIGAVFEPLRRELTPVCQEILGSGRRPDVSILRRDYPLDRQRIFSEKVSAAIGFDFERGRIDITHSSGVSQDSHVPARLA